MENKTWQIQNHQDEYLEIMLPENMPLKKTGRVFYLHESKYLTCYVHIKEPRCLLIDIAEYTSLKKYLLSHHVSQSVLKEWIEEMIHIFYEHRQEVFLNDLSYIYIDEENGELRFVCLPVEGDDIYREQYFSNLMMALFENIEFEGDEEWLSQLYMLVKQKPLRYSVIKRFLNEKPKHHYFSFFFKKKYEPQEDFFKAFEVHEDMVNYASDKTQTTIIQDDFKTQILMAGFQCGYLEDEKGRQIFISQSPWIIGRQEGCQQRINLPEISKQHARIVVENGRSYLMDLNSTNGTEYNGRRLNGDEKVELKDGDCIQIAHYSLIYHE